MSKKILYEIILFKYPHADSMTLDEEKVYIEEFSTIEEAREWADKQCNKLPRVGTEVWTVYYVDWHE